MYQSKTWKVVRTSVSPFPSGARKPSRGTSSHGPSFSRSKSDHSAPRSAGASSYSPRSGSAPTAARSYGASASYAPRSTSASFGGAPRSGGFSRRPSFSSYAPRPRYGGGGSRRSSYGGHRGGGSFGTRHNGIEERLFINKAKDVEIDAYVPKHTFADFNLHPELLKNITFKGYKIPSPIQDQAIPTVITGKDVVGVANTGTGKTAAFLLPLIMKILANPGHKVMVLAPTRELAQQIETEFRAFAFGMHLFSVIAVGGMPIYRQMRDLERGFSIVIGTPGRVKDLIERGNIKMEKFGSIVLDEADRMLDMGFIDDIRSILKEMPKERQSLFFSATMPPEIKALCATFLKEPAHISVKTRDTASNVDQDVVRVSPHDRIEKLHELLKTADFKKVLIFREMKRHVEDLGVELRKRGFKALSLHGDMRNRERMSAVRSLTTGEVQVVVATDVAARGIDIKDITHVINYDVPKDYETYVHRVGRTGRGSSKGSALTFVPDNK
jgi:superfamily II DNA/RNA helicase